MGPYIYIYIHVWVGRRLGQIPCFLNRCHQFYMDLLDWRVRRIRFHQSPYNFIEWRCIFIRFVKFLKISPILGAIYGFDMYKGPQHQFSVDSLAFRYICVDLAGFTLIQMVLVGFHRFQGQRVCSLWQP